jgi:putative aminopeptidase FrvX
MGDFNVREMMNKVLEGNVFSKSLKKELISIFNDLVPMYVPSGAEDQMVIYASTALGGAGFEVIVDAAGNIEATRGYTGATKLVAINAHTDTVQGANDAGIAKGAGGALYNWMRDEFISEGYMIGGDDKCGVAVALCLAKHTDLPMKIVLTTGEEIGGLGMKSLRKEAWDNVAFCFTVDRMHGNDLISRYCGRPCAPKEFVSAFTKIAKRNVGVVYVDTSGSWADTASISDYVPAVNLSAGYYNPHTSNDFIKCDEMYKTMMSVKAAIENQTEIELAIASAPADWQKVRAPYYGYEGYARGGFGGYYDDYNIVTSGADDWNLFGKEEARVGRGKTRPQRRGQSTLGTSFAGRKGKPKANYKKCRIDFKDRDDKEEKIHIIEMNPDEEEIISNYVEGETTDAEWELLLLEGVITTPLFNVGIDLKLERKNNEKIAEAAGKDDNDVLLEFEEEALEEEMQKCGFLPGSAEWTVYSDYLIGAIDYSDLQGYANANTISQDLVRCAVKAKKRLGGTELGKELENWKKEAKEEQDYFERKETLGKSGRGGKRSGELSPFEQENLLDEFVEEEIDDAEWELYLKRGKISKSTYDAGFIERDFVWKSSSSSSAPRVEKKQEARQETLRLEGDPERRSRVSRQTNAFVEGDLREKDWKRLRSQGLLSRTEYETGMARKRAKSGLPVITSSTSFDKEKGIYTASRMTALIKEFVAGHISEAQWDLMLTTGSISKVAHNEGISKRKQYKTANNRTTKLPKSLRSDDPPTTMSKNDGLELARQFALGSIDITEWERMHREEEIPVWVYDRGLIERGHYINHGYFSDYMNTRTAPQKYKSFELPTAASATEDSTVEGVSCSVCEEQIDRFAKDKITYQGWLTMRASGEISGDTFLRGIKIRARGSNTEQVIKQAKKDLAGILSRYKSDFDTYEDVDVDVR